LHSGGEATKSKGSDLQRRAVGHPSRIPGVEVEGAAGQGQGAGGAGPERQRLDHAIVAEVLAAVAYGELCGARRSQESIELAPDGRSRTEQQHVAHRERQNYELIEARLRELGDEQLMELFRPYFDAFFQHTKPTDWVEAQTFHYVGDALVSDFADVLVPLLDRVSAEVVRRALGDREDQETFALDELTRAMEQDPVVSKRIRRYTQRIIGEAFTQTGRALEETQGLRALLGGEEAGKRFILSLLDRHRQRFDRLGIDPVDTD
jgi:tRNA-(MS[2]IO[6]A)-hydroxylase MiaE-like protein